MILNKKMVRKNKALKKNQKTYRKENRDRRIDRGSVLKKNIEKVISLSSKDVLGNPDDKIQTQAQFANAKEFISYIERSGLTGMSGNGFPVCEKLEVFSNWGEEKTIIINGVECEPGLLHDEWLMTHKAREVSDGIAYLGAAFSPERMILATRGKKNYLEECPVNKLEVVRVPLKYPMGEEHILIKQLLGKELDINTVPATEGILVINVQTVYQISRIMDGSYNGGHFVTLGNLKTGEARVAYVNDESNIYDMLKQAFGKINGHVYAGGGISHSEIVNDAAKFTATTSFAAIGSEVIINNDNMCKKCGGCTKKCPMGIRVTDIVLAKEADKNADISMYHTENCIHCGTCTYYCFASKDPGAYVSEI